MRQSVRMLYGLLAALLAVLFVTDRGVAASPSLSIIRPRGIQRGAENVLTFRGRRLGDAEEIFFYEPGFQVTKLDIAGDRKLEVHVKVASDCRLGEHTAQVRTKSGISEYRTFYVGPLPAMAEEESNNLFKEPQPVELNHTITGRVTNEDVDYFVVEAKKGQRISAEIEAMRLGSQFFDPSLAILDADRFVLASADDTTLVYQDAVASIVAPETGRYIIKVREAAYGGSGNSRYRLHLGSFPRPTAVYPAGGKIGQKVKVRFLGDPAGEFTRTIKVPDQPADEFGLFPQDKHGQAPSANPFRPSPHGNVLEHEPNNSLDEATEGKLPLAFNGIIEKPGDVDCFRFEAKKGQRYDIECYARRIRSPLDAVMAVYRLEDGKRLKADDDSRRPDSRIRYRFRSDGEYAVRITDHRDRGGRNFVYRVEFRPVEPSFRVQIPRVKRYSQERQTIVVPRGNRYATLMTVRRRNFRGEVTLKPKNLPDGIRMQADPMPANMNKMPVLFKASDDAPIDGRLLDFQAVCSDEGKDVRGQFWNTADLIRGRGNTIFWQREVDQLYSPAFGLEQIIGLL